MRGRNGSATSASAQRIAHRAGAQAKARRAPAPTTMAGRIRRMLSTVGVPHAVVILGVLVIALATLLLTSSPMAWLPTIVAQAWMVFNLAPVSAGGITIGFVPLLPAALLGALVAARVRAAVKHKVSINDLLVLLACVLGVPTVLTVIAWLMLWDAGKVYDVSPAPLWSALPRMLLLHACALILGMGSRLWKALAKRFGVPRVLVDASRTGLLYLGGVLAAGAVLVLIMWVVGLGRQSEMFAEYPVIDGLGKTVLFLLSILYLPNAAVGAGAILGGSEFHIGADSSISLFSAHSVPLPPLPLAAAVPGSVAPWAVVLLALPAVAAGVAFYQQRQRVDLAFLGTATLSAAVGTAVLSFFAGGELGFYGSTGPTLWTATGLLALWCLVVGGGFWVANLVSAWRLGREANAAAAAEKQAEAEAQAEAVADADAETEAEADAETDAEIIDGETVDEETEDPDAEESEAEEGVAKPAAKTEPEEEPDSDPNAEPESAAAADGEGENDEEQLPKGEG
ncbi:DUF6350 family protein [Corynebacterium sp.]|uniref:cell division protein PerM n=1 Tax=Corynebacterium sp. TaxID=1720 RepID=UPI0026DC4B62|nr:DUF6350 family protein [Corynebacterium sp.]MDO5032680.1 DUF6350 family protein [Corynebacterium sp.]